MMGASICWEPVKPGRALGVGARSKFIEALALPCVLTASDEGFLRGLAKGEPDFVEAVETLLDAVSKFEAVRVWAEY